MFHDIAETLIYVDHAAPLVKKHWFLEICIAAAMITDTHKTEPLDLIITTEFQASAFNC